MTITAQAPQIPVQFAVPCDPWCVASHAGDSWENWHHAAATQAIDVMATGIPVTVNMVHSSGNAAVADGPLVFVGEPSPGRGLPGMTLAEAEALGSMLLDIARRGYAGRAEGHEATFAELEGPDYAAILDGPLTGM